VAMNLLEQAANRRRIIHLVNYYPERNPSIEDISIRCTTPHGQPANAVHFYVPDANDSQPVEFRAESGEAVFTVPRLRTYGVITVSW
jgi:hypothetical protein